MMIAIDLVDAGRSSWQVLLKRDPANTAPGGGSIPHRHRRRAAAESAEFRAARGARSGETLSIDGPRRRRPCRPRARTRRLFADTGIYRDRRSANVARGA